MRPPEDIRDVYLDDFADTDDEVEADEDEEERRIRREERRKAKGKSKAGYNPLVKPKKVQFPSGPSQAASISTSGMELLDPSIDPSTMAPSTLLLTMRKQRRDAKRQNRSEAIRSTLRASTLKTEQAILEKEQAKADSGRKGRKAQHHGGEPRGGRKMTQDELIAAALEEEERNKESLRDWLKREEQRRELRRVGRKRVRGPRWTWVSRTVGRLVEEVEPAAQDSTTPGMTEQVQQGEARDTPAAPATALPPVIDTQPSNAEAGPSRLPAEVPMTAAPTPAHIEATPNASSDAVNPPDPNPSLPTEAALQQYTRNYLILSQVPGGLAAELQLILGDHVEWDKVQYIPHRNRPISESQVRALS
jgi:vacuolar protein sorting-associated protein 72